MIRIFYLTKISSATVTIHYIILSIQNSIVNFPILLVYSYLPIPLDFKLSLVRMIWVLLKVGYLGHE
jgi:hypothetical protein